MTRHAILKVTMRDDGSISTNLEGDITPAEMVFALELVKSSIMKRQTPADLPGLPRHIT